MSNSPIAFIRSAIEAIESPNPCPKKLRAFAPYKPALELADKLEAKAKARPDYGELFKLDYTHE